MKSGKHCRFEIPYGGEIYCERHLHSMDPNGIWYIDPRKCDCLNTCRDYRRKIRKYNYTDFLLECWKEHTGGDGDLEALMKSGKFEQSSIENHENLGDILIPLENRK